MAHKIGDIVRINNDPCLLAYDRKEIINMVLSEYGIHNGLMVGDILLDGRKTFVCNLSEFTDRLLSNYPHQLHVKYSDGVQLKEGQLWLYKSVSGWEILLLYTDVVTGDLKNLRLCKAEMLSSAEPGDLVCRVGCMRGADEIKQMFSGSDTAEYLGDFNDFAKLLNEKLKER